MEKKNEYIDRLLVSLQSLEAKVSAIQQEESVSFSFFRDVFQQMQEMMNWLHQMEMSQIEEMKLQMGKLVLFLSECENRKPAEDNHSADSEMNRDPVVPEAETKKDIGEQAFPRESETIVPEEKIVRRNAYAEGVTLPAYTNPRVLELKNTEAAGNALFPLVEPLGEKTAARSVNDIIQAPPSKLNIKQGLSLNDRFYYQRELFDNDREAMNSMMVKLNAFDNYEDTERYLGESTSWDFKNETVKSFLELLKRGFE